MGFRDRYRCPTTLIHVALLLLGDHLRLTEGGHDFFHLTLTLRHTLPLLTRKEDE